MIVHSISEKKSRNFPFMVMIVKEFLETDVDEAFSPL